MLGTYALEICKPLCVGVDSFFPVMIVWKLETMSWLEPTIFSFEKGLGVWPLNL